MRIAPRTHPHVEREDINSPQDYYINVEFLLVSLKICSSLAKALMHKNVAKQLLEKLKERAKTSAP